MNEVLSIIQRLENVSEDTQFHKIEDYIEFDVTNTNYQIKHLLKEFEGAYNHFESTKPFYINVIKAAARGRLKETAHSIILHDLLHHPVILSSFLEEIVGVDGATFSVDEISYPDQNRIDLSLANRSKFLILENKVNAAQEQEGQIYRYYSLAKDLGYNYEDIIILYLNPYSSQPPSIYSRSKDGLGKEGEVTTIPIEKIIVRDFKHDILNWLRKLEKQINPRKRNEPYLSSAICQYIDYLEDYFELKDIYKELHKMTKKQIKDIFSLDESLPLESQIEFLNDKKESLSRLSNGLDLLISKLNSMRNGEFLSTVLKNLGEEYEDKICFRVYDEKNPEIGFDAEVEDTQVHITFIFNNGVDPYWRVYGINRLSDNIRDVINKMIAPIMGQPTNGSQGWDIYQKSSHENCQLRLKQLADIFLSSEHCKVL